MAGNSKISWTDTTWNPITGCSRISAGCANCYAERMAKRLAGRCGYPADDPFRVTLHKDKLLEPLGWKKPRIVFVCSMGDLFHEDVPDKIIRQIWDVAWKCPQHIFLVLTKRPERMKKFVNEWAYKEERMPIRHRDIMSLDDLYYHNTCGWAIDGKINNGYCCAHPKNDDRGGNKYAPCCEWLCPIAVELDEEDPECNLPSNDPNYCEPNNEEMRLWERPRHAYVDNIWLGVTAENQGEAQWRIPILLEIPAAKHFVSCEPMLGPINLHNLIFENEVMIDALGGTHGVLRPHGGKNAKLDWVIVGGETGPKARPMHPDWARSLRDQCVEVGTPFHFKSWGEYGTTYQDITTGEPSFRMFPDFETWVRKADTWVNGGTCLDRSGKVLRNGGDFRQAEYPVAILQKIGTRESGRILDGVEWDQFPEVDAP